MSKRQWLMLAGVLMIALPFLGFPSNWDTIIFVIVGLIVIAVSYSLGADKSMSPKESSNLPYIEHRSNVTKTDQYQSGNIAGQGETNINSGNNIAMKS